MPEQMVLSVARYLDQFCLSVFCASVSSARQASLLRPRTTPPRPAASQLGPTCSVGGPPPLVRPVRLCDGALEDRGVALAGCDGARESCWSLRTSAGRSIEVGCRCLSGACRRAGTPWAKQPLAPSVNIAKLRAANRSPAANLRRFAMFGVAIELKDRMVLSLFCRPEHAPPSATDA
jgi:hypothetical protein